jgi:hypothetical protein
MRRFVLGWKTLGHQQRFQARIVNYADDFVICCRGTAQGQRALCVVLARWGAGAFVWDVVYHRHCVSVLDV